jgi:hypothetical protein
VSALRADTHFWGLQQLSIKPATKVVAGRSPALVLYGSFLAWISLNLNKKEKRLCRFSFFKLKASL